MAPPPAWLRALVHEQDVEPRAGTRTLSASSASKKRAPSSKPTAASRRALPAVSLPPYNEPRNANTNIDINASITSNKLPPYKPDLQCKHCKKLFRRVCNYREHQRVHSKEYKFRCTIPGCDSKFLWRSSIQAHLRSHQAKLQNRRRAASFNRNTYPPIAAGVAKYSAHNINRPPLSPISTLPQPSQLRPRS